VVLDWLTGGLVGVALLQLTAFVVQASALRESVRVTREMAEAQSKDMQRSLATAQQAADAATAANKLTQDFFITTERPWVTVKIMADGPLVQTASRTEIPVRFVMTNVGRSPAGQTVLAFEAFDGAGGRPSQKQDRLLTRAAAQRASDTSRHGANIYPQKYVVQKTVLAVEPNPETNGRILFIVACCVTYNFAGVRDNLQSGYTYYLDWQDTPIMTTGDPARIVHAPYVAIKPWFEASTVL
jgi:hypothetical protein